MTDRASAGLERYRNHNRVLLVFTPTPTDEGYQEQKRLLEASENGLHERDLVVLEVLEGDQAKALRDSFEVASDIFALILIGKDGGEKERFLEPVQPEKLFGIIDQMPMRRREMRRER